MNILTQSAFTTIGELWQLAGDADDTNHGSPKARVDTWYLIANTAQAFAVQHSTAQMHAEAETFSWLQELAITRGGMVVETEPEALVIPDAGQPPKISKVPKHINLVHVAGMPRSE